MDNCARRWIGGGHEETTTLGTSTSARPNHTSRVHTPYEECLSSLSEVVLADRSGAGLSTKEKSECLSSLSEVVLTDRSGAGLSTKEKSEYFSARVEAMMRSKGQFLSDFEHEIEHSRDHWTEVASLSDFSENTDEEVNQEIQKVNEENKKVFAELLNDPQWTDHRGQRFFGDGGYLYKLGRKIAEGGQAEIFEVLNDNKIVLKVFKMGSPLSGLKQQWPSGIIRRDFLNCVCNGVMLHDGRFAFVLRKCWGDLRKLIDEAMQAKNNRGRPFPYEWNGMSLSTREVMLDIAVHMHFLHQTGIFHRDLKAANILLMILRIDDPTESIPLLLVADFECSIGICGTTFWRAPEILLGLKNRDVIEFSEKADVYSYGMTCFEIVTGRLPFEGELEPCRASYDLVIGGRRPKLPSDMDESWKDLIERCWHPTPSQRPTFTEILKFIMSM